MKLLPNILSVTSRSVHKCQLTNLVKSYSWACNSHDWEKRVYLTKKALTQATSALTSVVLHREKSVKIFPYRESLEGFCTQKNRSCCLQRCTIVLLPVPQVSSEITGQELKTNLTFEPRCFVPVKKRPRDHAVHSRLIPSYQKCSIA